MYPPQHLLPSLQYVNYIPVTPRRTAHGEVRGLSVSPAAPGNPYQLPVAIEKVFTRSENKYSDGEKETRIYSEVVFPPKPTIMSTPRLHTTRFYQKYAQRSTILFS